MLAESDITFRYTKGTGAGGQHKNKTSSCVVATHTPTKVSVRIDGRCQHANKRKAIRELNKAVDALHDRQRAEQRKAHRDEKIRNETRIRTYDYTKGVVKDHRTGKTASLKNVMGKGKIELLH